MTEDEEPTTHETTWSEHPSTAVAVAVAEEVGREPTDGPVLDDYIDTDALDELMTGRGSRNGDPVRISFTFDGVEVTVDSDGGITMQRPLERQK
jgi:hypothetical protein